jgi:hypothetical protein
VRVGKIVICGSQTLPHMSIKFFSVPSKRLAEEGLSILLSTFGARLTRDDVLIPCFDLDELRRRNMEVVRKLKEK